MNQVQKLVTLFILLHTFLYGFSQTEKTYISLIDGIKKIESEYPILFSYQVDLLTSHIIVLPEEDTFEAYLRFLNTTTLFEFQILEKNTVTVRLKDNVISSCGVVYGIGNSPLKNTLITSPYQKVYSDDEGKYNIYHTGQSIQIIASYQGYDSATFSVTENEFCNNSIVLLPEINALETVELQNYLARGITKNANGSITVDYTKFDLLPGLIEADVLQTLKALPGIQSVDETVSNVNIRGGTNDQNLILWDGIKMYQNGHFFGLISAFNPFLTEKVTLTKNGSSAQYGDGVSGIIAMEGSKIIPSKFGANVGFNLLSTDAFIETPLTKNLGIQISGRKSISGLLRTPTYNQYFDKAFQNTEVISNSETTTATNDDFSFFDTNLRVLYQPSSKDAIRANFIILGNDLSFLENATLDNIALSRRSGLTQNNLSGGVWYQRNWSETWQTEVQLYGSSYQLESTNFDILNEQRLIQQNEVLESGMKIASKHTFSQKLKSTFGYQFNETGITNFEDINAPIFQRRDKQVLRTNSVFSEILYTDTALQLEVNAGARLNHFSKFETVLFEPRVAIKKKFLTYFSAEVLGEIKSQTTSQIIDFQDDFLGVENRRWVLSNPDDIPIIKSNQVSAGISYNRKGWLINVEGYFKEVDGITSQSQGFQNQFQDVKTTGMYRVKGLEFLLNKRFKRINTWLGYTLAHNEYTFDDLTPSRFYNNIDVRNIITYGINYTYSDFKLSGGFNWHSGKPTTLLVEGNELIDGNFNFEAPNSSRIDDYFRVDISAMYDFNLFKNTKAQVAASVWNVLNTNNSLNHFYRINSNDTVEEITENSLRITPNFSFRVFF